MTCIFSLKFQIIYGRFISNPQATVFYVTRVQFCKKIWPSCCSSSCKPYDMKLYLFGLPVDCQVSIFATRGRYSASTFKEMSLKFRGNQNLQRKFSRIRKIQGSLETRPLFKRVRNHLQPCHIKCQ